MMKVYFIQRGESGSIKIGRSTDVGARLRNLQTGSDEKLFLRKVVEENKHQSEATFHDLLKDHRLQGEWFAPHENVLYCMNSPIANWGSGEVCGGAAFLSAFDGTCTLCCRTRVASVVEPWCSRCKRVAMALDKAIDWSKKVEIDPWDKWVDNGSLLPSAFNPEYVLQEPCEALSVLESLYVLRGSLDEVTTWGYAIVDMSGDSPTNYTFVEAP